MCSVLIAALLACSASLTNAQIPRPPLQSDSARDAAIARLDRLAYVYEDSAGTEFARRQRGSPRWDRLMLRSKMFSDSALAMASLAVRPTSSTNGDFEMPQFPALALYVILGAAVFGVIGAMMATGAAARGFFWGAFLGPIGLVIVAIQSSGHRATSTPDSAGMGSTAPARAEKKCPVCAETIKAEAIKCRFCGENLQGSTVA